jgi:hypothetical protein
MDSVEVKKAESLEIILDVDKNARTLSKEIIAELSI